MNVVPEGSEADEEEVTVEKGRIGRHWRGRIILLSTLSLGLAGCPNGVSEVSEATDQLANKAFTFPQGTPFKISGTMSIGFGPFTGTPPTLRAEFGIKSVADYRQTVSVMASGTVETGSCTFAVTFSSYPATGPNAGPQVGDLIEIDPCQVSDDNTLSFTFNGVVYQSSPGIVIVTGTVGSDG